MKPEEIMSIIMLEDPKDTITEWNYRASSHLVPVYDNVVLNS